MKAISLLQPWASLVMLGVKRFETRSWRTNYRGPLAIHASVKFGRAQRDLCSTPAFLWAFRAQRGPLPLGCVIATCVLSECVRTEELVGQIDLPGIPAGPTLATEFPFGDFTPGRFAWLLSDIRPLATPIQVRGALNLWEFDAPSPEPELLSLDF